MMRLGAQLFTLRDYTQTAQDLDRSLEQVARMGYQTVQVSAIGPIPAQQVRGSATSTACGSCSPTGTRTGF